MCMASTKERAFDAFEEHGPDAYTAAEWAERLDTNKAYIYQLRGDFREQASPEPDPEPDPEQNTHDHDPSDEPEPPEDPEHATDGGDIVTVGHEGKEKLSPAGFEDESVSSIPAPDGVELPEDANPDDFEPGGQERAEPSAEEAGGSEHDDATEPDDSGGGLLSRIRGDRNAEESPGDVVDDAPSDEEAERREDVLGALEGANSETTGESEESTSERNTSTMQNGLVMDEDLVADLFGMPFAQAENVTGWEGWSLSEEEKQANARLIVAYCDEQNIDLSAGGMLAMSLLSTVGGRAAGYANHRRSDEPEETTSNDEPEPDPGESETTDTGTPSVPETADEPTPDEGETDDFDFGDASTWD